MKKIAIFVFGLFINMMIVEANNSKFKVTLSSCIDGDTAKININGEDKTVRFLSINAPEIAHDGNEAEPYGNEASLFTCNALKNASSIKLQYDPKSDETDKYGRVLAWVFVDNELLQEKLINNGLAEVKYVYSDYLYSSDLQALEVKAQEKGIGMWSLETSSDTYSHDIIDINFFNQNIIYIIFGIILFISGIFKGWIAKRRYIKKNKTI